MTVASQFKEQVNALVKMLASTTPNYVRCIKPNAFKAAQNFHGGMVLEQLRYSGVLESIEIRKAGYAMRLPFLEFFQRYRIIIKGSDKLAQAGVREDRGGGGHPARPVDDGQQQDLPQDHGRGAAAGADGYQSEDDVGEDNPRSRALLHLLRQVPADEEGRGLHQPQGQGLCAARALPAPAAERRVYPGARARLTDEKPARCAPRPPEVREVLARIAVTSDPKKLVLLRQELSDLIADMRQKPESHFKGFSAREAVLHQGWLLKKNLSSGKSKTRYCVLLPNRLLCYTSPECDALCSEFNLKGCECVADGGDTVEDPVYNHSFCVTTARHSVVLAAPTNKLKAKWIWSVQDCHSYSGPESSDLGILVRVGWLKKYVMTTKGWTNVYAVLRDDLLTFYSNEHCDVEKGHCRIGAECRTDTTDRARTAIRQTLHAPTEWYFHVYAGSSQVYLCAPSDSLMNGGVRDVHSITRRVKGRIMEQGSPWQDPASKSLKQGWLWYKAPPSGQWSVKYCVLTSTDFLVFENDSCMSQVLLFLIRSSQAAGGGLDAEALKRRMEEAEARRKEAQKEREATKGLLRDAAAAEADRLQDVDDILLDVESLHLKEINLNLPEVREVLARIAVTSDPKKLVLLRQELSDLIAGMRCGQLHEPGPAVPLAWAGREGDRRHSCGLRRGHQECLQLQHEQRGGQLGVRGGRGGGLRALEVRGGVPGHADPTHARRGHVQARGLARPRHAIPLPGLAGRQRFHRPPQRAQPLHRAVEGGLLRSGPGPLHRALGPHLRRAAANTLSATANL